jgi:hypothetical protein
MAETLTESERAAAAAVSLPGDRPKVKGGRGATGFFVRRGTRRRYRQRLRQRARQTVADFMALNCLDPTAKRELRPAVRHSALRVLFAQDLKDSLSRTLAAATTLALLLSVVVAPLAFAKLTFPDLALSELPLADAFDQLTTFLMGFGLFFFGVSILFILLTALSSERALAYMPVGVLLVSVMIAGGLVISAAAAARLVAALRQTSIPLEQLPALMGSVAVLTYFAALAGIQLVNNFGSRWLARRAGETNTNAFLIDGLLRALLDVEKNPGSWPDVKFRKGIIARLESVAVCLELLPAQLRSGHLATDHWVENSAAEMAAGVRGLTKWVVNSKPHTREKLLARLAADLSHAARGDWNGFERVTPEKLTRPELIRHRAANLFKALAAAAVPVLALLVVKQFGLVQDATVLDYLTVGVCIWAALTLLSGLDPHYGVKITAIKDIGGLLLGRGK